VLIGPGSHWPQGVVVRIGFPCFCPSFTLGVRARPALQVFQQPPFSVEVTHILGAHPAQLVASDSLFLTRSWLPALVHFAPLLDPSVFHPCHKLGQLPVLACQLFGAYQWCFPSRLGFHKSFDLRACPLLMTHQATEPTMMVLCAGLRPMFASGLLDPRRSQRGIASLGRQSHVFVSQCQSLLYLQGPHLDEILVHLLACC
jgi:hypothetical protein